MRFILRMVAASLVLFLLGAVRNLSWQEAASAVLVSAILCWITERSRASGVELVVTIASFYFILVSLTTIPEGVLFDVVKVGLAPWMMARQLGIALVLAMAIAALFQKFTGVSRTTPEAGFGMTILGLLWRLAAAVVVFMACYFAAGILIYPLVKSYYQGRSMPVPGAMVAMIILKAMCLVIAAWLVLRRIPNRRDAQLILTAAFPVIGVFSLMLHHNEFMPPAVRWGCIPWK